MRVSCFAAFAFANLINAQFNTEVTSETTQRLTAAPTLSSQPTAVASPCAAINENIASYSAEFPEATEGPFFSPSLATQCLESVPLSVDRSSGFIDFIRPYIQFQSTLSYLKDPPKGYPLPGADVLGGLDLIQKNIQNGVYKNQWSFEKDLWSLVNVLPHDFHFNLPLPLVSTFVFATYESLVSISDDGLALPSVYFKSDLDQYLFETTDWKPSAITKINGEDTATYLEKLALTMAQYQDPDALYNQMFYSPPTNLQGEANFFYIGAWQLGFDSDTNVYTFENGSTQELDNYASVSPAVDFSTIVDGPSLFQVLEVDPTTDVTQLLNKRDIPEPEVKRRQSSSSIPGYPEPWIIHPEGFYTAGYFLGSSSEVAVLVMTAFTSGNSSSTTDQATMQLVVSKFLAECGRRGSTQLIIDLSANGGGNVFSGYDVFKQLFPTVVPYGGSRMRTTPFIDYMGNVFSSAGVYNESVTPPWQIQSALDQNLTKYPSWADMGGPFRLYGDNFLGTTRANLSDPLMTNDFSVYGYLDKQSIPAAVFDAQNMVVLYDGSCGSTCAIFSEFMKTQGGVRSIAVGGRPQAGPMQGVAGSKGAQVYTYLNIEGHRQALNISLGVLQEKKQSLPDAPDPAFVPPEIHISSPLGSKVALLKGARMNLRSAIRESDTTQTPLQFVYEAANCHLFYTVDDVYDMTNLWARAYNATWGGAKCIGGSTTTSDASMPGLATDTVAYTTAANTNIQLPDQPGLVAIGSTPGTGADSGIATFKTGAKNAGEKVVMSFGLMGLSAGVALVSMFL